MFEFPGDPYSHVALETAKLVAKKQKQYGNSADKSAKVLEALYPDGIPVAAFGEALLMVRMLDKLSRIAQQAITGIQDTEDAWADLLGYSLLGLVQQKKLKPATSTIGKLPVIQDP